jgi:hypothetical protein
MDMVVVQADTLLVERIKMEIDNFMLPLLMTQEEIVIRSNVSGIYRFQKSKHPSIHPTITVFVYESYYYYYYYYYYY